MVGAMIHRPVQGSGRFPPGHCEELPKQRRGNPRPWQKVMIFHRNGGVAGQQSLPCVKGGGVRKDDGGIDAEQFTFCDANSDYSMSKNPATHSRKPHAKTNRWGTIPQSRRRKVRELRFRLWGEKLRSLSFSSLPHRTHFVGLRRGPQKPRQPPLHKGAFGAVRRRKCCGNLKLHSKGRRIATPVTSVTGSQ